MNISKIFAAALVAVAGLSPVALATPAAAQRTVVTERTVVHRDVRPRYGHRVVTRRVCSNRFYNGRRHRVCRVVRTRR